MANFDIRTGDIDKWAEKMEARGADFAADVVKETKRQMEQRRKERKIKFEKIRRQKTGKRFASGKGQGPKADLTSKNFQARMEDIFKD